jgi:phage FluMu protein Com
MRSAQSIRCAECGKLFRSVDEANFHASKSGHDQFEESTEEARPSLPSSPRSH